MTATPPNTYYALNGKDADFENVDIADDLVVGDDASVGGDLTVTGALTGVFGGSLQYNEVGADGAVTQKSGVVGVTKAGVCAMTIADPTDTTDDGKILFVVALTANEHTLSNAAGSGFNSGGASSDVGTFGGAIGDNIMLLAAGGKWIVISSVNVSLA